MLEPRSFIGRLVLLVVAVAALTLTACGGSTRSHEATGPAPDHLIVGVPAGWGYFSTMKERNVQIDGTTVEYRVFPYSADARAALNAGRIDILETGDTGAALSKVSSGNVKVVAVTAPNPAQSAFLVRGDSAIRTPADLKGKTLAVVKSTNSYPAALNMIKQAGLAIDDVKIVDLGGEGYSALRAGKVDVTDAIDPYLAKATRIDGMRVLTDFTGLSDGIYPILASQHAFDTKKTAIRAFLVEYQKTLQWIAGSPDEHARLMATFFKIDTDAITDGYARGSGKLQPIDDDFETKEQRIVDEYAELGIIKKTFDVRDLYARDFNDAISGKVTR